LITVNQLLLLRKYVIGLIDVLDKIEQIPVQESDMSRQDIIDAIAFYGVNVNRFQIEGLTDNQLSLILQALEIMGDRFLQLAETCGTQSSELTAQGLTNMILTQPIEIRYDNEANRASTVDENAIPGTQILTFDRSAFFNSSEEIYSPQISYRIIIHEFGHIFHNVMNQQISDGTMTYTRTVDGQQVTLKILPNTPDGIVGYVETVGAFYYTTERDFDYPPELANQSVDLTSLNFPGAGTKIEELYFEDTNMFTEEARIMFQSQGMRVESNEIGDFVYVNRAGNAIQVNDEKDENIVKFVEASTYIASYTDTALTENLKVLLATRH